MQKGLETRRLPFAGSQPPRVDTRTNMVQMQASRTQISKVTPARPVAYLRPRTTRQLLKIGSDQPVHSLRKRLYIVTKPSREYRAVATRQEPGLIQPVRLKAVVERFGTGG